MSLFSSSDITDGGRDAYFDVTTEGEITTISLKATADGQTIETVLGAKNNYIQLGAKEVFEGNGYTLTVEDTELDFSGTEGLFEISFEVFAYNDAPTIQNLNLISGHTNQNAGYFLRANSSYFNIVGCSVSEGTIDGNGSGGICGAGAGSGSFGENNGRCSIINCYTDCIISGTDAGGICGSNAGGGPFGGRCDILNCYSTGNIVGDYAGGIVGNFAGNNGVCNIIYCYSEGTIGGLSSGGICGVSAGTGEGNCYVLNCFSLAEVTGDKSGGIMAPLANSNVIGDVMLFNCFSEGTTILSTGFGGLVGLGDGITNKITIVNCYSAQKTGNVSADTLEMPDLLSSALITTATAIDGSSEALTRQVFNDFVTIMESIDVGDGNYLEVFDLIPGPSDAFLSKLDEYYPIVVPDDNIIVEEKASGSINVINNFINGFNNKIIRGVSLIYIDARECYEEFN